MESFIYEGTLRHRRFTAPHRTFDYSLFMMYLDLAEVDSVFARRLLWSADSPNLSWFRRADHYGNPSVPLHAAIGDLVAERTGTRPTGPIRILTHLRYLGVGFNPVSFYYCFGADGRTLETIVAEVANTPWGERHMYVLPVAPNRDPSDAKRFAFPKAFHVSPFLPMEMDYVWRFGDPGPRLWVNMENHKDGERAFQATLTLERRPINGRELARILIVQPAMTLKVVAAIYTQALRLWLGGATFHPHPRRTAKAS